MEIPVNHFLKRKLGFFSVTSIVVANMIGAGIFTTSGILMETLGNPLLMIALWVVGGAIAISGALCYGELGAAIPKAGGEYTFLTTLYHPLLGFLSGWISFIAGFSAPIAASSIGFSEYLYRTFPALFENQLMSLQLTKNLYSIGVITIFTLVHLQGISFGSKVQNYLTLLKVGLLAALIFLGFAFGNGDLQHLKMDKPPDINTSSLRNAGLALMWIMFAYSGWNASTYIGAEVRNPSRNLSLSLLWGTFLVMALYACVNILFVFAIPPIEMQGVISVGGLAVNKLFGPSMDRFFSLMIAVALFSSISAFIILGPRVYYAMASDGYFFKFAAKINPKTQVPSYSIVFQALAAIVIVLSGTFDQILTYIGFSLGIFPIVVAFSLFKLRKSGNSKIRLPGYPFTPVFFIVSSLFILILSFIERPLESLTAIAVLLAGVPFYFYFLKKQKRQIN